MATIPVHPREQAVFMPVSEKRKAVYDDLFHLPEHMTGEIIEGELHAFPRPGFRHSKIEFTLSGELAPPFCFGRGGGPGGWIFLIEPEVMLGENLLVPDLASWKEQRLPDPPQDNWTTEVPDWICEILSPGTLRIDRVRKMPIYARHGLQYLWLIDPVAKILEVYTLKNGAWTLWGNFAENDKVRAEPFIEAEIDPALLWWGD